MGKIKNIVLDLDQTLISAEANEEYDFTKNKEKAKRFDFQDMDGYYIVFERPGLQNFLDYLFSNYTVSVWTAASKDYALFIIDKIILRNNPGRRLDWVFFSYHCNISKKQKNGSKSLSMLWDVYGLPGYDKDNTVIVDDYDEVYEKNKKNCIVAIPFEFTDPDSPNDKYLQRLATHLENYKTTENVRVINNSISKRLKQHNLITSLFKK